MGERRGMREWSMELGAQTQRLRYIEHPGFNEPSDMHTKLLSTFNPSLPSTLLLLSPAFPAEISSGSAIFFG